LHVDDDECFLETAKQVLEMEGRFEVETATSVDEALSKINEKQFDAVISDYEMPSKNGLQFLRELKEQKNDVAFILFTGRGREEVAVEALNLGADRYINKCGAPVTVYYELANAINLVVESKQAKKLLIESESKYRALDGELPSRNHNRARISTSNCFCKRCYGAPLGLFNRGVDCAFTSRSNMLD